MGGYGLYGSQRLQVLLLEFAWQVEDDTKSAESRPWLMPRLTSTKDDNTCITSKFGC